MNLSYIYKLFTVYFVLSIISCNKPPYQCDAFPNQSIEIKFINQQGQNLFFGSNSRYRVDSVQVLNLKSNFNIHNASVRKGFIDSNNVLFHFYAPESKSYVYYNQQTVQDSIEIKWIVKTTKCERGGLLEYTEVDSLKFNNILIRPVNGVFTFVK